MEGDTSEIHRQKKEKETERGAQQRVICRLHARQTRHIGWLAKITHAASPRNHRSQDLWICTMRTFDGIAQHCKYYSSIQHLRKNSELCEASANNVQTARLRANLRRAGLQTTISPSLSLSLAGWKIDQRKKPCILCCVLSIP